MNTAAELTFTSRLAAALAAARAPLREVGGSAWEMQSAAGGLPIQARAVNDWLQMFVEPPAAPVVANGAFLPTVLLRWNGTLAGNARFSVTGQFVLALRVEVPVMDDLDPGPRLAEAWDGMERGLALCVGQFAETTTADRSSNAAVPDLKPIAEAAGWVFHAREDGRFVFALDDADAALGASLQARADGSVRAWATLVSLAGLSESSQRAVAVLLLRLGAALRFARPVFTVEGETSAAELEVIFATPPQASELALALEGLAVGASLAAAEAKLLCHEQTAKEFLIVGNWASREAHHNTTKGHA